MMTLQRLALPFILFIPVGLAVPPKGTFTQSVYPVLEAAACRSCHQADGVASTTRLQFPEEGASDDLLEKFGLSLVKLVDTRSPEKSFLLAKPTNRIAHAGGERIPQGSSEEKTLRKWVDYLATLSPEELDAAHKADKELAEGGEIVRAVSLRRLTHAQYNNTVRDLLHEISAPANQFPPEDFINGFKNQYQAQSISPLLMEAYSAAAAKLARNAFRGGDARGLVGCKPSAACRSKFIREFGSRAFRRPLGAAEIATYEKLFQYEKEFLPGAQLVIEAMLQSPYFLFRIDDTEDPKLRPYATASRLSYAIWDTMPDETLMAKAAAGKLDTPEGIEAEVRRLFASPRARPALDEFVSQWMRFDRLMTASKNRRAFPWFNRETAVAMTGEAKHFVADLVWSDRNFMELFTSPNGYVNGDLANVYKVPAPQKEFSPVPFPADSERAGILGQALFLALTAKPEETSPTARGLFVREQFLCQHVADPPPGVNTNLPEVSETRPQTNRERLKEHTVNQSCAGCHSLIDPIGFGLEKFDAAGMRREKLKLTFTKGVNGGKQTTTSEAELPLDTTGFVAGVKSSNFSSPKELGAVLARTPACQQCIVKQYFRWTAGRMETPADRPLILDVANKFEESGFRFKEMAVTLIMARERQFQQGATHVAINHKTR